MSVDVTVTPTQGPPQLPARVRLYDLAKQAREEADGDEELARMLLSERLTSDTATLIAIVPEIVDYAFRRQLHGFRSKYHQSTSVPDLDQPKRLSFQPKPESSSAKAAEISAAHDRIRSWLDYPLPGGKPLGDATFGEVGKAADFYGAQARGNALKERILRGVHGRRPSDIAIVRDILTNEEIDEIVRGES